MHIEDYRTLYESAPVGLWRTKVEDGEFLFANTATATILGYERAEDLIGLKVKYNYQPGIRERLLDELLQFGFVRDFEALLSKADGSETWVRITARVYPQKGYIEGLIQDINDRKIMERELTACRLREVERLEEINTGIRKKLENTTN